MTETSKQDRIREIEAELRKLRGEDEPAYTFRELQALSKEDVDANWDRVQRSLAGLSDADVSGAAGRDASGSAGTERTAATEPTGPDRIARGYAKAAEGGDAA